MATPEGQLERVTDGSEGQAAQPAPAQTATPAQPASEPDLFTEINDALQAAQSNPAVTPAPAVETPPSAPPAQSASSEVVPAVEPPAESAPPTPEPRGFARLYDLAQQPGDEPYTQAVQVIREDAQYDPIAGDFAREAMFIAHRQTYHEWALAEMGVSADKVAQFAQWVKDGARPLPPLPAPPSFPDWDSRDDDGYVVIPTANGTALKLNPDDPKDREIYDNAKYRHEQGIAQQQADATRAEQARLDAEKKRQDEANAQQQVIARREGEFSNARLQNLAKTLDPLMPKLAEGDAWLEGFVIHAVRGHLAYLEQATDEQGNPKTEFGRLSKLAGPYIQSGAGRAKEIGEAMDRLAMVEIRKFMDGFNKFYLRANKAERALTATQPQVPAAPSMTVTSPAAPSNVVTGSEQFMKEAMAEVQAALGQFQR